MNLPGGSGRNGDLQPITQVHTLVVADNLVDGPEGGVTVAITFKMKDKI
jgi:hypothetical protein